MSLGGVEVGCDFCGRRAPISFVCAFSDCRRSSSGGRSGRRPSTFCLSCRAGRGSAALFVGDSRRDGLSRPRLAVASMWRRGLAVRIRRVPLTCRC